MTVGQGEFTPINFNDGLFIRGQLRSGGSNKTGGIGQPDQRGQIVDQYIVNVRFARMPGDRIEAWPRPLNESGRSTRADARSSGPTGLASP
jgi:hypothetical protein